MGALDHFLEAGLRFKIANGKLRAYGDLTDDLRAAIIAAKPQIIADLTTVSRFREVSSDTSRGWRISIPGRQPFEVRVLPGATADEMQEFYPSATVEPLIRPTGMP